MPLDMHAPIGLTHRRGSCGEILMNLDEEELMRLRRMNELLRQEREILIQMLSAYSQLPLPQLHDLNGQKGREQASWDNPVPHFG